MTENKYHKGKIYSIRSPQTDKYYIGSTTQLLSKRLGQHKEKYKKFIGGLGHNISSFEIIKFDDCYIELLENYKCESKEELNKREGELIRFYIDDVVNKCIAGRTKKQNYIDNRDKILEKCKQYQEINKDNIKEYNSDYYLANKDKIRDNVKEYQKNNRNKINERRRQLKLEKKIII